MHIARRLVRAGLAAAGLAAGLSMTTLVGCASLPAYPATEATSWPMALTSARSRAAAGRFGAADTVLATFASMNPGRPEALETAYWRALYKVDPGNPNASLTGGLALLDGYLADPRPREHVDEATIVRRLAAQLESLNRVAATAALQARDAAASAHADVAHASDPPPDAEIKRLRDELAKANAELDRIRRRLAQPPVRTDTL